VFYYLTPKSNLIIPNICHFYVIVANLLALINIKTFKSII